MKMPWNQGKPEDRPVLDETMRKERKRRKSASRKKRYLRTDEAFFDLMA
jgi:hypothetical protein